MLRVLGYFFIFRLSLILRRLGASYRGWGDNFFFLVELSVVSWRWLCGLRLLPQSADFVGYVWGPMLVWVGVLFRGDIDLDTYFFGLSSGLFFVFICFVLVRYGLRVGSSLFFWARSFWVFGVLLVRCMFLLVSLCSLLTCRPHI